MVADEKILEETKSICPECFKNGEMNKIDARIVEEEGKIWIKKECPEHGSFKSIFFEDPDDYERWRKYDREGNGVENVEISNTGLYSEHKSQSVLTNLLVTNRCNLRCSYCFMNAGASGYVYEPSLEEIDEMMDQARREDPVPSKAIQITGGEPTVRDDLFDIVEMADEKGFSHIQLNTNGIKLAESKEYCKKVKNSPINTVYMSFDGMSKENNPWIEQHKQVIQNFRDIGFTSVVLVPVAMKDNVDELGDIIRFAQENIDVVRGVNFQPIAFTGRIENIDEDYRKQERVDYSTLMKSIEEGLDGEIRKEDWYPTPFVYPISKLVENLKNEKQVEFTAHPGCGGATYVFDKDGELLPITRFLDVEKFMKLIENLSETTGRFKRAKMATKVMKNISEIADEEKSPEGFSVKEILTNIVTKGSYEALGKFHHKSLFLGSMWFQDVWNINIDRLQNCVIHYTTPEGMVPFCAYNGLGVGDKIREKHSIPVEEWEEEHDEKLKDGLWKNGPIS